MLPERLRTLRTERKLSQEYMGDLLGITRQAYAKYEKNDSEPDIATINKLSSFFDVTTDYLLGNTDKRDGQAESSIGYDEEKEFQEFAKNPKVKHFFKELSQSPEEQFDELRKIWDIIKIREAGRKPGDKQ